MLPQLKNKPDSIRRQLLLWLMAPLCTVWLITTGIACWMGENASAAVFDQQLLDSADSVAARIEVHGERVIAPLPDSAREIIERGVDHFYYEVRDDKGRLLSRSGNIIAPDSFQIPQQRDVPVYCDGKVGKEDVRVVAIRIVDPQSDLPLILIAAETLEGRRHLTGHFLLNILISEIAVIAIGAAAVSFGVSRGLMQLRGLQSQVTQRSLGDLRPIEEESAPVEVLPLVRALNDLLDRLRVEIDSQKRFVANAAHQIRTPVAGMKTYVALARRMAQTDDLKRVLEQVDEGTDRLTHLVNRLLSLARAEPNARRAQNYAPTDLNDIAATAVSDLVTQAIGKEIELGFEPSAKPAVILGSPESLEELVINIVENAILYTQRGGQVNVRVTNGDGVLLTVEDNGPGIPPEEREHVFDRFYRALGTEVTGSGLGLAIVKEIAAAHGAQVTIHDGSTGCGTAVQVHLPAAPGE